MDAAIEERIAQRYGELSREFDHWEKTKDLIDQLIDVILNYRQSGHPGGSRSKVHALIVTLLGGVMRWDIRHPEKRFGDRFVLVGGHTIPLVYCTLALLNESLRIKYTQTGDARYLVPNPEKRMLTWEDLLKFRHRGGLSGHAEMEGKTLFLKFNTGPSGHGSPAAAGLALALKRAGAEGVKVFAFEGDAGLTPGAAHETMNSAWGLALDNLYFVVDWNDYGIDDHPVSSVVYGTPTDWFASHGWRVSSAEFGSEWGPVTQAILTMVLGPNPNRVPSVAWVKTRKGRGYLKYDNPSHGAPHPMNSDLFWQTKRPFAEKYGAQFTNFGGPAPGDAALRRAEFEANLKAVIEVLHRDQGLVDYLADTLVALGDSVPQELPAFRLAKRGNPYQDGRLYDYRNYPADIYVTPGTSTANRAALAKWGAWVNAFGAKEYGRPLVLACSADLADSTNISGFAKGYGDFPGYGRYERFGTPEGVLLPTEITEFANSGMLAGMATVNFAPNPEDAFDGFWGACSTYGSFSYLKYGMMRLLSQLAQDCQWKVGKVIWVAGHSGPETADDSRTHFGIFEPGVTQLFPEGHVINLYPWEYNEVPVLLGAALRQEVPIVALHLTRPPIEIPDREKLGMASHFEAARGAYLVREYRPGRPKGGVLIVQGTSAMVSIVKILPELDKRDLNVKIVYAASPQLFALQSKEYVQQVLSAGDRADSTVLTTQARWLMHDWLFNKVAEEYAMSSDWDNRWRTGGTLDEVIEEAHLSPEWVLEGIERFVRDRDARLGRLQAELDAARDGIRGGKKK
ncbi:MAG: transketolase [candidate division NC10 bacterium RIFCSPLOWO2_02_FULL_66_22]|nr:MAG: transketolase [candidate division NC10 bacterium RIFCSPLOWO2_02_FULL_66_22]